MIYVYVYSIVAGTTWPNLRVTFGLSPFGHFFYPYPLHDYKAIKDGWEKISSCGDDTPWFGNRWDIRLYSEQ